MTKATAIIATLFIICSLGLTIISEEIWLQHHQF